MNNNSIIKTIFVAGLVSLTLAIPQHANANELQRLAENLCKYAKTDNRASMRKKLKGARIRLKDIYPGLTCGSAGSLMRVAVANDALNAAKFIARKAGKRGLSGVEKDGKTALQFTEGLVGAGDASKQPFVDILLARL